MNLPISTIQLPTYFNQSYTKHSALGFRNKRFFLKNDFVFVVDHPVVLLGAVSEGLGS